MRAKVRKCETSVLCCAKTVFLDIVLLFVSYGFESSTVLFKRKVKLFKEKDLTK